MVLLQKPYDISSAVAVESFCAFGWEATCDDSICDVRHVEIEFIHLKPSFISRHFLSNPVEIAPAR